MGDRGNFLLYFVCPIHVPRYNEQFITVPSEASFEMLLLMSNASRSFVEVFRFFLIEATTEYCLMSCVGFIPLVFFQVCKARN
jgi:hypothetical protein